jgi:hypothetical protein
MVLGKLALDPDTEAEDTLGGLLVADPISSAVWADPRVVSSAELKAEAAVAAPLKVLGCVVGVGVSCTCPHPIRIPRLRTNRVNITDFFINNLLL